MAAPEIYQIAQVPLTCHSFSADRSRENISDITQVVRVAYLHYPRGGRILEQQ